MKKIIATIKSRWIDYLLEIIVIIIGILVAFSLSNWSQKQIENKKKKFYLREINIEFKENKMQLEERLQIFLEFRNNCDNLIKNFPLKENNVDSILNIYRSYGLRLNYTFDPSYSSLESMVNSSTIDLVENKELTRLLISWKTIFLDYKENENSKGEFINTHLQPFEIEHFNVLPLQTDSTILRLNKDQWHVFENLIKSYRNKLNYYNQDPLGEVKKMSNAIDSIIKLTEPYAD